MFTAAIIQRYVWSCNKPFYFTKASLLIVVRRGYSSELGKFLLTHVRFDLHFYYTLLQS